MVFNDEGALCVVLNGEGMDLDPASILLAGNEAHMQFLHPVATDRHTGLFGQCGHLQKAGDAAAIGGIGLDETQVRLRKRLLKFMDGMQVFPHRQGHSSCRADLSVAFIIIRDDWLFKPGDIIGGKGLGCGDRFLDRHRIICVHHECDIWPNELAHRFYAGNIFRQAGLTDFDFHAVETTVKVALDTVQEFWQGEAKINATAIGFAALRGATGHLPKRLAAAFATQIP